LFWVKELTQRFWAGACPENNNPSALNNNPSAPNSNPSARNNNPSAPNRSVVAKLLA
jgi:hypothetical protein